MWCTEAESASDSFAPSLPPAAAVGPVTQVGTEGLRDYLAALPLVPEEPDLVGEEWDRSVYRPVTPKSTVASACFGGSGGKVLKALAGAGMIHAPARTGR